MSNSNTFDKQINFGWGLTFHLTGKAPAINKRIFHTLDEAKAYADDYDDSAVKGLLLSVISDETKENNGVYFLEKIKEDENDTQSVLTKIGAEEISKLQEYVDKKINAVSAKTKSIESEYKLSDENIKSQIGELAEGETIVAFIDELNQLVSENTEAISSNKLTIDDYTVNNKKISTSPTFNSDDFKISTKYSTTDNNIADVIPDDALTTAISKIEIALANTTLAFTAALNDLENRIGTPTLYNEDGSVKQESTGIIRRIEELEKQTK